MRVKKVKVGIIGLGAAGTGIAKLLMAYGVKRVLGTDLSASAMAMHEENGGVAMDLAGLMEQSPIVVATTGCPGLIKPEMVRPGQVIGLLGNSGNSDAPHLHFHLGDAPSPLGTEGLPFLIARFEKLGVAGENFLLPFSASGPPEQRQR